MLTYFDCANILFLLLRVPLLIYSKPILILPDLSTKTISVCFTQPEREFYNALLHKSISVFDGFLRKGTASKSWFAIFSLLQKLRQACNHPALTVKSHLESTGKKKNNAWPVKFESSLDQKNCSPGSILQEESKSTLNNNVRCPFFLCFFRSLSFSLFFFTLLFNIVPL